MSNKSDDERNGAEADSTDALRSLLSDPTLWAETDPALEDSIVELIASESALSSTAGDPAVANVTPISEARGTAKRPRLVAPSFLAGIAAAVLVLAGFAIATRFTSRSDGIELVLSGTDLAPEATANALIDEGPFGVEITLDVNGLPPAPEGHYYQAWVRKNPEVGISIGTFHMNGGDGDIVLWAGVSTDDYPLVTVTIQEEGAGEVSSGIVVLKGQIGGN